MRLRDIEIDGFGAWTGLKLTELPGEALVIYGPNEAGKTTLMQFVRTVLYGFSPQRRLRYMPPVHGGKPGGRLLLSDSSATYIVYRTVALDSPEDDRGVLMIEDTQGRSRGPEKLAELLASVDEATFNNVFAIGLREIQELSSLADTAAADHLYKLATGLDRVSLVDVARELTTSRERLIGDERNGQLLQLIDRRDRLQSEIEGLAAAGRKWAELASERGALADEAAEIEDSISRTDANSRLVEAALEVQPVWQSRVAVERQIAAMGDVRPLPDQAVEKLESLNRAISGGRRRLKQITLRRRKLRAECESLEPNRLLLNQAPRIEALTEHSQWIITLDQQILKLSDEIAKIEIDIEAQLGGASRNRGVPGSSIEQVSSDFLTTLRRPSAQVREANETVERMKKELDLAQRNAADSAAHAEAVARERRVGDVSKAIKTTGEKVSLLRRRIQLEERLEQLERRRSEVDFNNEELREFGSTAVKYNVPLGFGFALGAMLIGIGMFCCGNVGALHFVDNGPMWGLFGLVCLVASGIGKFSVERKGEDDVSDNYRHIEQVRNQLNQAKQERDELDAQLPPGGGAFDARLREAEGELRELEKLIPLRQERESAESRIQAAERRLAESQEAQKQAKQRWRSALRAAGLPEDFTISQIKAVMKESAGVADQRRRRETRLEELQQKKRELLVLTTRIQQLLADVRITPKTDKPQAMLHQIAQAFAAEKELVERRNGVLKKARGLKVFRRKLTKRVKQALRRRQQLLNLAGVADQKAFRQLAVDVAQLADYREKHDELSARIRSVIGGKYTEQEIAAMIAQQGGELEKHWTKRVQHVHERQSRLKEIHKRQGACTHEMKVLADDNRLAKASLELTMVEEELRRATRRWQVLTLVGRGLETVRKAYETNRQPETLRDASQYLHRLTLGQYRRIWMPLDRQVLLVEDVNGQTLTLEVLSRGTREAVYLSLRMALVVSFARRGARIPLVLDDVLVNFDAARVRAAAEAFRDFAIEGYQLIMFTCHEHIRDLFTALEVEVRTLPARALGAPPEEVPAKPKRKKKPEPVVELPIAVIEPEAELAVDPNPMFDQASVEEIWFDPTNAYELARQPEPAAELPDFWPIADSPPATPISVQKTAPLPPQPRTIVHISPLPDSWPIAEPPPPLPPPPAAPHYKVISFRYLPEPPKPPRTLRASVPPPPPTPAPPPLAQPVIAEAPEAAKPTPPRREKPAKHKPPKAQPPAEPPAPAEPTAPAEVKPVAVVARSRPRRRFAWESPEMVWTDDNPDGYGYTD